MRIHFQQFGFNTAAMAAFQSSGNARAEALPHLFGANALQYRQGTAVANADTPPTWAPEMASEGAFPYTLSEWQRDVGRWLRATKASEQRVGPLLSLAVGGAARVVVDELEPDLLAHGADLDLGSGRRHYNGVELIFHVLQRKFPENLEARMLRTGFEFFSFTPRRSENLQTLLLRFDTMSQRAEELSEIGISWLFKSWMLMSLLRLSPSKWSEYLKDMGHRFRAAKKRTSCCNEREFESRPLSARYRPWARDDTEA